MNDTFIAQEDGHTFLSPQELADYREQQAWQQWEQGGDEE